MFVCKIIWIVMIICYIENNVICKIGKDALEWVKLELNYFE